MAVGIQSESTAVLPFDRQGKTVAREGRLGTSDGGKARSVQIHCEAAEGGVALLKATRDGIPVLTGCERRPLACRAKGRT